MFRYAQIDVSTGVCFTISDLFGEVDAEHMILLEEGTDVQTGDIFGNGQWTRPEPSPDMLPQPTIEERLAPLQEKTAQVDERTLGMQDIDLFTLGELQITDERTTGMQDIDDYTLQVVFDMQALIDSQALIIEDLKARVATLEGGV